MIVPLDPMHFELLSLQPSQSGAELTCAKALALLAAGKAMTCLNAKGRVVACAGLMLLWEGRGMAWANFGAVVRSNMTEIVRAMAHEIDESPFHRVEMYIAHPRRRQDTRLAELLGFRFECTAKWFLPDKSDVDVFVWTRHN